MFNKPLMKNKSDYLTKEEIEELLDKCIEIDDMRFYMLIQVLYRTGRRISEVVGTRPWTTVPGLRPCDIHPDGLIEWTILKKQPIYHKNKRGVKLTEAQIKQKQLTKVPKRALKPVDLNLLKMLDVYIRANNISDHFRVFPICREWADRRFQQIVKQTTVSRPKRIHLHTLRHSFSIHLLQRNPNNAAALRQLQMLLDHENLDTTMEYAQFTPYDQQDILEKTFNDL